MKWLMLAVIIIAQQPAKAPESKGAAEASVTKSTEQTRKTNHDNNPAQPCVSVTVNNNPPSPNEENDKKQTAENIRIQRRLTLYTGLLVIAGFVTAALIWWQAKKTAEATKAMQDSLPHQETAALAAKTSADALTNAERAWLTVKVGDIFQGELEFRYAKVPIKNTGRTPARVKQIVVTSMLIPFPKQGWGRPGELPTEFTLGNSNHTMVVEGRDFVIPPGGEHMMYAVIFNTEWSTLTKKLSEGKQSWYVYGFVEYFDTIEGRDIHKTGFCEIYWVADEPSKEVEGFRFTANLIPPAYICAT
jgi:hypothetical protein